jgi:uncharacterized protein (TIGR02117 family)
MNLLKITGPATALRALVGWLLLLCGLFVTAGWIGGLIPASIASRPTEARSETLFIETNGVHVAIIVPTERFDPGLLEPGDFGDPAALNASHLRFGWGQHEVYRRVPEWSDLTPGIAWRALVTDGRAMVHVSAADQPVAGEQTRSVRVSTAQMDSIITDLVAAFQRGPDGDAVAVRGNWADEAFYPAHGRYSALFTCNSWAARILNRAGIRTGAWPIFQGGVMRWLAAAPVSQEIRQ